MNFLEVIKSEKTLVVSQVHEWGELLGFETRNKYTIQTEGGQSVGFAAEQDKSFWAFFARMFLGHWRKFDILIFNEQRQPMLKAHHPFRWYFQTLQINDATGRVMGALVKRFSIFSKKFDVHDTHGRVVMEMRSPIWRIWTFYFSRSGTELARVEKKWSGLFSEAFTDRDKFRVVYGSPMLTEDERQLLLAAAIFIDLSYFERKANN